MGTMKPITAKPVHVLSIRQPHIDQILFADKFCENRSWPTRYRGELYLHASRWEPGEPQESPGEGITGAIIGKCTFADCVLVEDLDEIQTALFSGLKRRPKPKPVAERLHGLLELAISEGWEAASFNRHCHGEYCFILTNRKPLAEPIPVLGKLNIWTLNLPAK